MKSFRYTELGAALLGVFLSFVPIHAQAVELQGDLFDGSIDSTVSFGTISRVQGRDSDIVWAGNGGNAAGPNTDNGNLNYDTGIVSQMAKIISDIEINHKSGNMGAFLRVRAYWDTRNDDNTDTKRTDLSDRAVKLIGRDLDVLDAYGWARFDVAKRPAEFRFGKHVLNWGESTFIPGGVNVINPVDKAALRAPGSELREALLPVNMLSMSMDATDNLSVEGFYQLEWDRIITEPSGSFFSTNDYASDGGDTLYVPAMMGPFPDTGTVGDVSRSPDNAPSDGGQWGVALRYFSEELNNTEFGLYYLHYHSRRPVISGRAGTNLLADGEGYMDSASYFLEYPEDIELVGVSFNTGIGEWALQGEYSYHHDLPLQVDDAQVIATAMYPLQLAGSNFPLANQLAGGYAQGYIRRNVSQAQVTASRIFNGLMGANRFALAGEAGITHVHNMPTRTEMPMEGAGPSYANATSYGYRLSGRWTYNNVIKGINLLPHAAFQHDVNGVSPTLNFLEDRKAATLGVSATYKEAWAADVSYTSFFGAGRYNTLNDRDYVQVSVKYSF